MPDSTASKPEQESRSRTALFPRPRTMGSFVILVTALAFTAGWIRNELALFLLGTIFLSILVYCFLGVFFLGLIHRRKAGSLSLAIVSETVSVGKTGELLIKAGSGAALAKNHFLKAPAILLRCELCLETRDGRVIRHYVDPGLENYSVFPVKERGAYYGEQDNFVIFDAPGFFRLSLPLPQAASPRLFAVPLPAEELIPLSLRAGGTEQRYEPHYRKSDELTDHRPYIPGDDPRRINWKLYSHAPLGELFVREGEPQPPPHSRLLILIDTEADRSLYTINEGRLAVDLLCENALAAALDFSSRNMDISIGCSGGIIIGANTEGGPLKDTLHGNVTDLAAALAWPAAIPWPGKATAELLRAELPAAPNDMAVLILALPRTSTEASALDRFLKKRETATDIVFLYDAESKRAAELADAARVCVNLYNGKSGMNERRALAKKS